MKYRVTGTLRITYSWEIDEEIEAESEDDAAEQLIEDCDPFDSFDCDTDTFGLDFDEIDEDESEQDETARMLAIGAPMLPGFEP